MSRWEQPRSRRFGSSLAAIVGAAVVAVLVATVVPERGEPAGRLEISSDPSTEAPLTVQDTRWRRPRPGTWRRLPIAPLTSRGGPALVWTGTEVIVWGGFDSHGRPLTDGGAFDPATGTWRRLVEHDAHDAIAQGVWTGAEAVFVSARETFRYDPTRRRWHAAPTLPVPVGHALTDRVFAVGWSVVAVTEPFVRDGSSAVFGLDPGADRWQRLPDVPARLTSEHVMLPAGSTLLVFGRATDTDDVDDASGDGLRLDLRDDDAGWQRVAGPPALSGRRLRRLVGAAVGDQIVLWGASGDGRPNYATAFDGARWRRLDPGPIATTWAVDALWIGDGLIVWDRLANDGAILDPTRDRWTPLPAPPLPAALPRPTVWTGASLFTWGAFGTGGAMYTPECCAPAP
ncbi:MAG: hypothetical protein KY460_03160 [Actinobacteria bacterium]|nr:hypothetical protein [Actinomycetota bacterium]